MQCFRFLDKNIFFYVEAGQHILQKTNFAQFCQELDNVEFCRARRTSEPRKIRDISI